MTFSDSMRCELLCFGTELLEDKINSNSNTIAKKLLPIGLTVDRVTTVGDDPDEMKQALREALTRSTIIITCGGLGPTFDDLTRETVSSILKRPLFFSKKIMRKIEKKFNQARFPMPLENRKQAYVLSQAIPILNQTGTAPGQIIEWKNKTIIILPGPPKELIPMMDGAVRSYLKSRYPRTTIESLVLHTFGLPESRIAEIISPVLKRDWSDRNTKVTFGILAHRSMVDVKVRLCGKSRLRVNRLTRKVRRTLAELLGDNVVGANGETMEETVGDMLKTRKETLSIAESCTGGLLTDKITNVPGSSVYFKEGIVSYSNESKIRLLGVRKETLRSIGAVSREVSEEMAKGILKRSSSDWSVSLTGIAGPEGGTRLKPVGLVYFSIAHERNIDSFSRNFFGTRKEIKEKAALTALDLLRRKIRR